MDHFNRNIIRYNNIAVVARMGPVDPGYFVIMTAMCVFGVVGNSVTIVLVLSDPALRIVANLLIVALATIDLTTSAFLHSSVIVRLVLFYSDPFILRRYHDYLRINISGLSTIFWLHQ